jgi:alanine racemase
MGSPDELPLLDASLPSRVRPRRGGGIWSHLADADQPGSATVPVQAERYLAALDFAQTRGLRPRLRHLSNSAGLWAYPEYRFDLVRTGIAMYGLTPAPNLGSAADLGLVPAMTLKAALANVKSVGAGSNVSYGSTWTAPGRTTLGLVPVGYADGIPRAAGGRVEVAIAGRRHPSVGRIAMDQFVVDLGDHAARPVMSVPVRAGSPRRALGRRLGRRNRHHWLRDRHAHRFASAA